MKSLLLFTFTKLVDQCPVENPLSLLFSGVAAALSAFLDALTVTAVVITVASGFYGVYHRVASGKHFHHSDHDLSADGHIHDVHREDLVQFRAFLRSLVMHAAVGTALGGVTTLVGEPQNLLIAYPRGMGVHRVLRPHGTLLAAGPGRGLHDLLARSNTSAGSATACDYRSPFVSVLEDFDRAEPRRVRLANGRYLIVQALVAAFLVIALAFHWAAVGLIGLSVIVLATAFAGVTEEHRLAHAFQEALPFTALLVVFFGIVAVIHDQKPLPTDRRRRARACREKRRPRCSSSRTVFCRPSAITFSSRPSTSMKSRGRCESGTIDREQFDALAIAINTGTNIPSVATPNGQAAFLFLLTSALAPLIRLSYVRMVVMALPYTVTMTLTGLLAVTYLL